MVCRKCGKEGEFHKRPNGKFYYHCKKCQNAYVRSHYNANKKQYLDRNKRYKKDSQTRLVQYLREHPCVDCGESDPVVLDFDHVIGKKRTEVSVMARSSYQWHIILKEIAKCVIRCANCHRRKTYGHMKKYQRAVGPADKTAVYETANHGAHP